MKHRERPPFLLPAGPRGLADSAGDVVFLRYTEGQTDSEVCSGIEGVLAPGGG